MPGWAEDVLDSVGQTQPHADASAWILYHTIDVKLSGKGALKSKVRYLVKVLAEDGIERAMITEPVYPDREVKKLRGWIVRSDGSKKMVETRHTARIENQIAAGYYDDLYVLAAVLPRTDAGSVVAFEYEIAGKGWSNPYERLYLQLQEPVRFVSYSFKVAKGWQLDHHAVNCPDLEFSQEGNTYRWTARDLPYRSEEPLMPSWREVSPSLSIVCRRTDSVDHSVTKAWREIGHSVHQLMETAIQPDSAISHIARSLTSEGATDVTKAQAIGKYVRDQVRYVAIEIGEGRIRPRPASSTLQNLFGDCKDKTALTRAMLASIDLPSVPVLVLAGAEVIPELPSGAQFNHCIVGVPAAVADGADPVGLPALASDWLFFDPTAERVRFGHLPRQLSGQHALVCSAEHSELLQLPDLNSPDRRWTVRAELTDNGDLRAMVDVVDVSPGVHRDALADSGDDAEARQKEWQSSLQSWIPTASVTGLTYTDWDDSTHHAFQLEARGYAQRFGKEFLLNPVVVLEPESRKLTSRSRHFPIEFGPSRAEEVRVEWLLPDNLTLYQLPPTIEDSCMAGKVSCLLRAEADLVVLTARRVYSGRNVEVQEYETAQSFDRNVSRLATLTVLLKTSTVKE
jgi:transglutaminase-like putative cysteine protease